MSDPTTQNPAATQYPAQAPQQQPEQPQRKLSGFLKVSIILLAALTVASISLLFLGDFEGRFERVFSTFVLFAVFVLLTAFDTRRGQKNEWYAPVALIANAYILGLLLVVIWMTPYDPFSLMWEIFWKSLFVILVTRLVILACQFLLRSGDGQPESVTRFAFITSVLAVLVGIMYTAPVGIDAFGLDVPDLYWKISTALLILTALGLSITLLLRWFYTSEDRQARKQAQPVALPLEHAQQGGWVAPIGASAPGQLAQPATDPGQQLLPWPTFSDGTPLPALADGQPDFSVLPR